jgi:hypothetical protein
MVPPAPQKSLSGAITTEGGLIEKPALELLEVLGWQHFNLMKEEPGPANPTGRLSLSGPEGPTPIRDKDDLVAELEKAVAEARAFCTTVGVEVDAIFAAEKLARLTLISQAVEALVLPDDRRRGFFRVAGAAARMTARHSMLLRRPFGKSSGQ